MKVTLKDSVIIERVDLNLSSYIGYWQGSGTWTYNHVYQETFLRHHPYIRQYVFSSRSMHS